MIEGEAAASATAYVMASAAAIATMSATIRIQVRPRGRLRSSRGAVPRSWRPSSRVGAVTTARGGDVAASGAPPGRAVAWERCSSDT